jgi:hypothetical protein
MVDDRVRPVGDTDISNVSPPSPSATTRTPLIVRVVARPAADPDARVSPHFLVELRRICWEE